MKVLVLGTAYPWRGGIAHYIGLLAKYLSSRFSVDVVTFSRQYPKIFFPGKSQNELGDSGVPVQTEMLIDSINPFNWIRVGLKLRRRNYDVVIFKYWLPFFGPCFGTICHIIKFNKNSIVLAICDNVIPHERRGGDKLFTRYAFSSVDGFLVQSDAVAKDLKRLLPDAKYCRVEHPVYEIFGNAIDKSEARANLGLKNDRIILFFGYIRSYKGLDILLEAMNIILLHIDVQLLVIGEFYEDEERYHELTKTLGVAHRVNFVSEYAPNDKVALYFSAADCVVLPYRSATQSGIVQIAYNFNKPVIVTQVGGLAEVVKDGVTGFIVPPDDPIALADAVIKFYSSNYEQQFFEEIQHEKKRFSWQTLVDNIDAFVKEIQNEKVKA